MTWLAETAMLSHGWRRFLLLVLSGAVAGLSIPPLFVVPALFAAFPVWVWCLDGAEKVRGWRRLIGPAFTIGFAFGWGYFTVAFHWLGAAFFVDGGIMLVLMPFAILALAAMIAFFWGVASPIILLILLALIPYILPQSKEDESGRWFPRGTRVAQFLILLLTLILIILTLLAITPTVQI